MSEPVRHLHAVDPSTGEVHENCPGCLERDEKIEALRTEKRGWQTRYYALKRDKDADARADSAWPQAHAVFDYWRKRCKHPKAKFTADRFYLIEPFLREDGEAGCKQAIDGAAFDPYVTHRRNGTEKRHDGFELVFRDRAKFEEFQGRAPTPKAVDLLAIELDPYERNRSSYAPDGAWAV